MTGGKPPYFQSGTGRRPAIHCRNIPRRLTREPTRTVCDDSTVCEHRSTARPSPTPGTRDSVYRHVVYSGAIPVTSCDFPHSNERTTTSVYSDKRKWHASSADPGSTGEGCTRISGWSTGEATVDGRGVHPARADAERFSNVALEDGVPDRFRGVIRFGVGALFFLDLDLDAGSGQVPVAEIRRIGTVERL